MMSSGEGNDVFFTTSYSGTGSDIYPARMMRRDCEAGNRAA